MNLPDQLRKRALVLLIARFTGRVTGKTKYQKFAFLIQQESQSREFTSLFRFMPYYYGPYSADLANTVSQLVREQLIAPDEYVVVKNGTQRMGSSFYLTDAGAREADRVVAMLPAEEVQAIKAVISEYKTMPLPKLLEYVYSRYPAMTMQGSSKT